VLIAPLVSTVGFATVPNAGNFEGGIVFQIKEDAVVAANGGGSLFAEA
jgi:hypothetical protein